MWKDSLYTDGTKEFVNNPLPKMGETVTVYLRMWEDAPIDHIHMKVYGVEVFRFFFWKGRYLLQQDL